MDEANDHLFLVLGCFGRRDEDFISCTGVSNRILCVDGSLQHFDEMCEYLEGIRLFDKPTFDLNAIRHIIFNMQDRYPQGPQPLWKQNKFNLMERFILDHRGCGTFMRLTVGAHEDLPSLEQRIKIQGTPNALMPLEQEPQRFNLKVVRGRR